MPSTKNTSPDPSLSDQLVSIVRFLQEHRPPKDEIDEQVDQAGREQALRNDYLEARNQQVRDHNKLRKTYGKSVYRYLTWYSLVVALFVFLSGWSFTGFSLPSEVLIALVGSTAVSVITVVGFVVRGLFKTPPLLTNTNPE